MFSIQTKKKKKTFVVRTAVTAATTVYTAVVCNKSLNSRKCTYDIISNLTFYHYHGIKVTKEHTDDVFRENTRQTQIYNNNNIAYRITYRVIRYHNFWCRWPTFEAQKIYYPRLDWLQMYTMKWILQSRVTQTVYKQIIY